MDLLSQTFSALADPTRRAIVFAARCGRRDCRRAGETLRHQRPGRFAPSQGSGRGATDRAQGRGALARLLAAPRSARAKPSAGSTTLDVSGSAASIGSKPFSRPKDPVTAAGIGDAMSTDNLVIKRHFNAPPERVFAAFTDKDLMQAWFGPETMTDPSLRGRRSHRRQISGRDACAVRARCTSSPANSGRSVRPTASSTRGDGSTAPAAAPKLS